METVTTVPAPGPAPESAGRNWKRISIVLAALLAIALVAAVGLGVSRAQSQGRVDAERAATRAAERVVVNWLTYDYRTYRDDMSWVAESGTPKFRKELSAEALDGMRKRIVGPRQLVSRGRIVNTAATASDADHVKVLLFTDQTLTDKDIREEKAPPLHARSGVELTMVRSGGTWLVDDMVQLQFQ
jgi:Mce-associated membrane protein